jgi:uncharacterized protein (TIGR00369 family)
MLPGAIFNDGADAIANDLGLSRSGWTGAKTQFPQAVDALCKGKLVKFFPAKEHVLTIMPECGLGRGVAGPLFGFVLIIVVILTMQKQTESDTSLFANPNFAERVTTSFDRQNAMHLIRATLQVVEHGRTEIHVPHWEGIEQQHGFVHGGVVGMIADSAAGYAAMSMVAGTASVLTVEYKINLVAPADGEKLIARGQVVRAGRTLIVTKAEVFAVTKGKETLCALMQQTMMVMHGKTEK